MYHDASKRVKPIIGMAYAMLLPPYDYLGQVSTPTGTERMGSARKGLMGHGIRIRHLLVAASFSLAATACVKDTTTSPAGVNLRDASFVGYSNPDTKQTTCGNCHVLKQQSWLQTGHANAWADLQASGHAMPSCNQCHTVNGMSNIGPDSAGFFSVAPSEQKYYVDVQCEACHGPGQAHVTTPDETQPIPYFTSRDTVLGVGCGQCHSGGLARPGMCGLYGHCRYRPPAAQCAAHAPAGG